MARLRIISPDSNEKVPPHLCALGIMTKAPEPGKVKTRLSPPLTHEEAAGINRCFLQDLGETVAAACKRSAARGVAVYTPVGAELVYEKILPPNFLLLVQREGDFGGRLIAAGEDLFASGFESICLINSDSPTVTAASFAEAANALAQAGDRLVLGPSADGGYYLVGLKQMHRRIFQEIDWSTEKVFAQTMQRAQEVGLDVHLLPEGFDVDDRATLQKLCQELFGGELPAEVARHTRRFLTAIVESEGRQRIWPV